MKYDVFIIYSHWDSDEVNAFVHTLQEYIPGLSIGSFSVTYENYHEEDNYIISSAINESSCVLFALSDNSIVFNEVRYLSHAKYNYKRVIPVLLKNNTTLFGDQFSKFPFPHIRKEYDGWFLFYFGLIDCIDSTSSLDFYKLLQDISRWSGKSIVEIECQTRLIQSYHQKYFYGLQAERAAMAQSFRQESAAMAQGFWQEMNELKNRYQAQIDKTVKEVESLHEIILLKDAQIEQQSQRIAELNSQAHLTYYQTSLQDEQVAPLPQSPQPRQSRIKRFLSKVKDTFTGGNDKSTSTNSTRKTIDYIASSQTTHEEQGNVQASVFAPAEVKRKSHFLVQVYLHLSKDIQTIVSLASKSDKSAEQRDYIPLHLRLRYGDKVDIDFNIYGSNCLMNSRKSMIWQGRFDKCSFDYFVPMDLDVDQLSCEIILSVEGIPVGEMHFLTDVVEYKPRKLHPEIISHTFKKIFISYAHEDSKQVRNFALAYKAQGVDYFFDRDKLEPGDVYEEMIFHYIDNADLFILCWSANAAKSEYVAKEYERAMRYAYPQISLTEAKLKIFPISIEPRADLPADIKLIYNFVEL